MSNTHPSLVAGGIFSDQSVYVSAVNPQHIVGTRGVLSDGRLFEYVRNGGDELPKGKLLTYAPVNSAVDKIAVQAAAPVGSTTIKVTVTLSMGANRIDGGYISIDDDAGEAEMYGILGHAAHTSGTLTLDIDREIVTALTTNTTATIVFGPSTVKLSAGVLALANPVEVAAGVSLNTIPQGDPTNRYSWIQKTGIANVLFGTVVGAVGQSCYQGNVAGSLQSAVNEVDTDTDRVAMVSIGTIAALLPVSTEYHTVYLNIL